MAMVFAGKRSPECDELLAGLDEGFENFELYLEKRHLDRLQVTIKNIEIAKSKAEELKKNLHILSVHIPHETTKDDDEHILRAIELAKKYNAFLVIHSPYLPIGDASHVAENHPYDKALIENKTSMDLKDIVSNVFSKGHNLVFDIAHLYRGSSNFYKELELLFQNYASSIKLIHMCDSTKEKDGIGVGMGEIDFQVALDIISQSSYSGDMVIETKPSSGKSTQKASLQAIRRIIVPDISGIKSIIFDSDKTLYSIHTNGAYDELYSYLSSELKVSEEELRQLHRKYIQEARTSSEPKIRDYAYTLERLILPHAAQETGRIVRDAGEVFWGRIVQDIRFPHTLETLSVLGKEYDLAIASDEFRPLLERKINKVFGNWRDYFGFIITPEDTGVMKPSKKYYEQALRRLERKPSEVMVVGDSWERDLAPAKEMGFRTVLISSEKNGRPDFHFKSMALFFMFMAEAIEQRHSDSADNPVAFQRYDIRGKFPTEVNSHLAVRLGKALSTIYSGTIVVGSDNKLTSKILKSALIKGISSTGSDVVDVGIGPTDMIAFAGKRYDTPMSVMITASHLSLDSNGFKFMYTQGNGILNEDLAKVKDCYIGGAFREASVPGNIKDCSEELFVDYINSALYAFTQNFAESIDSKVIIDTADGAASKVAPFLLEKLGAQVIRINSDLDGGFRRNPDCSEEEFVDYLRPLLQKYDADIAIATDMDADRIAVFDSNGRWLSGDEMFCILAEIMAKKGDKVIASIDTSQMLPEVCKADIIYTRVGDPFVIDAMLRNDAILAGEPNGHYCDKRLIAYNSATFMALIMAHISKRIPEMLESLPQYFQARKKIVFESHDERENALKALKDIVQKDERFTVISDIDGIKFSYNDTQILARTSGTEPAMRVIAESRDNEKAQNVLENILKIIQ